MIKIKALDMFCRYVLYHFESKQHVATFKIFPQRHFRCSKRCTQKLWLQHFDVFSLHNFFPNKIFLRWWWLQKSLILRTRLKHLLFVLLYLLVFFVFESSTKQDFITLEFFDILLLKVCLVANVFSIFIFDCLVLNCLTA